MPSEYYTSPDILAQDLEKISRAMECVGRARARSARRRLLLPRRRRIDHRPEDKAVAAAFFTSAAPRTQLVRRRGTFS